MIFQDDGNWQRSLGRFLQIWYAKAFRGRIASPLLIGSLEFIFTFVSAILVTQIMGIQAVWQKMLAGCLMLTATTLTLTNATYIFEADLYALSLLFACMGAFFATRGLRLSLLCIPCFIITLGIYQGYLQVGVVLLMFIVFRDAFLGKDFKALLKKSAWYMVVIIASLVLYLFCVKFILWWYDLELSTGYNSIRNVGKFGSIQNILFSFTSTYKYVFNKLLHPIPGHTKQVLLVNILLFATGIFFIVRCAVKNKLSKLNVCFIIVLLLLLPFGMNFVQFISQGYTHELLIYSFSIVPLSLFFLLEEARLRAKFFSYAIAFLFSLIIFNDIIYANQCYVKKHLEREATLSIVTRIIDRIEETEGYVPSETPVYIIGAIESNPFLVQKRSGFSYAGAGNTCVETTSYTIRGYLLNFLGYPIKLARTWEASPPAGVEESLEAFPLKNCTAIKDGVLYIKLSE